MMSLRRTVTAGAVAILWLDALLLAAGGLRGDRPLLLGGALACGLAGVGVLVAWRRYRRAVAELDSARADLRRDLESLRALLRGCPPPSR